MLFTNGLKIKCNIMSITLNQSPYLSRAVRAQVNIIWSIQHIAAFQKHCFIIVNAIKTLTYRDINTKDRWNHYSFCSWNSFFPKTGAESGFKKNLKNENISYNSSELSVDWASREFQNQTILSSR